MNPWWRALTMFGGGALGGLSALVTVKPTWLNAIVHCVWVLSIPLLIISVPLTVIPRRRSKRLFFAHLSPEEREMYRRHRYIIIRGSDHRWWRIRKGFVSNVGLLDPNFIVERPFCAYPDGVPMWDKMLAQKLLIEANVYAFKAVALCGFKRFVPRSAQRYRRNA